MAAVAQPPQQNWGPNFPNGNPYQQPAQPGQAPPGQQTQPAQQQPGAPGPSQWTSLQPTYIDPSAYTGQIVSALDPQFAQQDQALQAALANAGIVGGSTAGAVGNLSAQQQEQLAGQLAPLVLQADQFNSGLQAQQEDTAAGFQNQDWLQQLIGEQNLNEAQAGAGSGAFNPIYSAPASPNFGQFGDIFGQLFGNTVNPGSGGSAGGSNYRYS